MKKRILCFLITFCILFSLFVVPVSAVLESGTFFKAVLTGERYGVICEKYYVILTFNEFAKSEFLGVTALVDYDADVFEIDETYMSIVDGSYIPDNVEKETYPLMDGEEGWVFWGNNSVEGASGIFSINILNDSSDIVSLKGNYVSCFIEFNVKENAKLGKSTIKIDTDDELQGVFSETLIESKKGTGSELSVEIVEEIPSEKEFITLKSDSICYESNEIISDVRIISGFRESTLVSDFIQNFENEPEFLRVTFDGNILEEEYIPTGSYIELVKGDKVEDYVLLICLGDVDSSGELDSTDYMKIKKYFLKEIDLSEVEFAAADIDGSKVIDSTDYLKMKNYFLGKIDIYVK